MINCFSVFSKDASPGPVHSFDPRLSRFGKDGTPSYSILGRQKDLGQSETHPIASSQLLSLQTNSRLPPLVHTTQRRLTHKEKNTLQCIQWARGQDTAKVNSFSVYCCSQCQSITYNVLHRRYHSLSQHVFPPPTNG